MEVSWAFSSRRRYSASSSRSSKAASWTRCWKIASVIGSRLDPSEMGLASERPLYLSGFGDLFAGAIAAVQSEALLAHY